jgi:hypothetical protein
LLPRDRGLKRMAASLYEVEADYDQAEEQCTRPFGQ